jgi:serine/threonine protein kinase
MPEKSYTEKMAQNIFVQLILCVSKLHKRGLAHRDLKPQNIIVLKDGNVKLIDLGLTDELMKEKNDGTPGFIDPKMKGKPFNGLNGDLYAL